MAEGLVRQQQLVPLPKRRRHYNHDREDVDDITVEILSRLPAKSLLRFRSVCKSWRALISDSYFVKKHIEHAVTDTSNSLRLLFFNPLYTRPRTVDLQGLEAHDHIRQHDAFAEEILDKSRCFGSCNGLICLQLQATTRHGLYCDDIFLWNPSTRVAKKLPGHELTRSHTFYGFGYDSATEDYKLILGNTNKADIKIAIFTLKIGSWRSVEDVSFVNLLGKGCFANGALHWLDSKYEPSRIVSFDLAEEKPEKLCSIVYGKMFRMGIANIRDRLCYYTYSNIRSMPITIFVMNEYGINKPWTKLMKIPTNIIPYKMSLTPRHILENGEVLMALDGKEFVIYDPRENKYRTVFLSQTISRSAAVAVCTYTLVSPEIGS